MYLITDLFTTENYFNNNVCLNKLIYQNDLDHSCKSMQVSGHSAKAGVASSD